MEIMKLQRGQTHINPLKRRVFGNRKEGSNSLLYL
jgi:hypothetical protein